MAKIGIYYGSDTGTTQTIAEQIGKSLGVSKEDMHDVGSSQADFSQYDVLLFGTSTMGLGDMQDDWDGFIDKVKKVDLTGKKVGLFGCGDSVSYSDTFCDGVGKIYQDIKNSGCQIIGRMGVEGYNFDSSEAVVDGELVGLLIDEDNESDDTPHRISLWIEQLKKEM